jgi:hypothetical protein
MDLRELIKATENLDEIYGPEEKKSFGAIDAGWYNVAITKAEKVEKKNGEKMSFEVKILGPKYVNMRLWPSMWISHTNKKAEGIGMRHFHKFLQAIGTTIADDDDFIGCTFDARVAKKKAAEDNIFVTDTGNRYCWGNKVDDDGYYNEVTDYRPEKGADLPESLKDDSAPAKKEAEKKEAKKDSGSEKLWFEN